MKNPKTARSRIGLYLRATAAMLWAIPVAGAGIALTATFVGAPIGIPLITLGCWPLIRVVQKRTEAVAKWACRDHPLEDQGDRPWDVDWRTT